MPPAFQSASTPKPHPRQATPFKIREKRLCGLTKPRDSLAMKKDNSHREHWILKLRKKSQTELHPRFERCQPCVTVMSPLSPRNRMTVLGALPRTVAVNARCTGLIINCTPFSFKSVSVWTIHFVGALPLSDAVHCLTGEGFPGLCDDPRGVVDPFELL